MKQTFKLKKGQISLEKDEINISDKAKSDKYFRLSTSIFGFVLGIICILRFYQTDEQFFYFAWLIITVLNLLIFVVTLSRSTKNLIPLDEVKYIKVKQLFGYKMLDIRLRNNRLRRVNLTKNSEELEKYIETDYNSLTKK